MGLQRCNQISVRHFLRLITQKLEVSLLTCRCLPLEGLSSYPGKTNTQGHTLRSVALRVMGLTFEFCLSAGPSWIAQAVFAPLTL